MGIAGLLSELSFDEQSDLVWANYLWIVQEEWVGIQNGTYDTYDGWAEEYREEGRDLQRMLNESVAAHDANKFLRAGITEIVEDVKTVQSDATGPQMNTFFKAQLSERIFTALCACADLDVTGLRFDKDFPTKPALG